MVGRQFLLTLFQQTGSNHLKMCRLSSSVSFLSCSCLHPFSATASSLPHQHPRRPRRPTLSTSTFVSSFRQSKKRTITTTLTTKATATSPVSADYGVDEITVLEGLQPVRLRPGMYIGSTGPRGLHHLVFEVVDNAVDEALAGYCKEINVTLHNDGSVTVRDDGRGIPTGKHPKTGKSALETVLTVLHAGGKFGGAGYSVSGGLHGVGVSVVNALSEWLTVKVYKHDKVYFMKFNRGDVDTKGLQRFENPYVDNKIENGTEVTFMPDDQIFTTGTKFDRDILIQRLDEIAYLNAGLQIIFRDERSTHYTSPSENDIDVDIEPQNNDEIGKVYEMLFRHDGGIKEYVDKLSGTHTPLISGENSTIFFSGDKNNINVEVALRWNSDSYSDKLIGFANNIRTIDGGTHLEGLRTSLTRTVNAAARKANKLRDSSSNIPGEYIREGLTAIVSVKVPNPEFEGQTKSKLGNPEVRGTVDGITSRSLNDKFEFYPNILSSIVDKAISGMAAAEAAKRAREVVRKKSILESSTLPGKLADCSSKDMMKCEIFIVEGESAGGSAKQARDREFQAILPLRGKILNIEKTDDIKMYQNVEIQALINALGLGIRGEDLKIEQLRYGKIVIMTDADVDGAHIRTLLLTFFFRYQRKLIEDGFIYIACPPLYKVERGSSATSSSKSDKHVYLYSDLELNDYKKTLPSNAKLRIQRFKGLGEMMPLQLWNTTMNPIQRQLKKVEVEDAMLADQMFSVLMGSGVAPRREFIESHAASLSMEDIDI